jgi:hypothetical protein
MSDEKTGWEALEELCAAVTYAGGVRPDPEAADPDLDDPAEDD